jgi:hypothetical protein
MRPAIALCLALVASPAAAQSAAAPAAPERPRVTRERIDEALQRYDDEPTVEDLVDAALRMPALDPRRASDAADRARWAGLLPQLRGDVRRGQVLDLNALQTGTTDRSGWAIGDELAFRATLTFRLDRLVFAPEETSLLGERRHLEERRLELVGQIVQLYFERRRLQIERDLAGTTDVATEMRIAQIEALLDAFTNGAFTRLMAEVGAAAAE